MPKPALIALYVIGALLEVGGIGMIVSEMRADVRKAFELPSQFRGSLSGGTPQWRTVHLLQEVLVGNRGRRKASVLLLVAGVIVSTAANIAATT